MLIRCSPRHTNKTFVFVISGASALADWTASKKCLLFEKATTLQRRTGTKTACALPRQRTDLMLSEQLKSGFPGAALARSEERCYDISPVEIWVRFAKLRTLVDSAWPSRSSKGAQQHCRRWKPWTAILAVHTDLPQGNSPVGPVGRYTWQQLQLLQSIYKRRICGQGGNLPIWTTCLHELNGTMSHTLHSRDWQRSWHLKDKNTRPDGN